MRNILARMMRFWHGAGQHRVSVTEPRRDVIVEQDAQCARDLTDA
jgi:hypothetical protein